MRDLLLKSLAGHSLLENHLFQKLLVVFQFTVFMLRRLQGFVMIDADVTKEESTFSDFGQFLCELNYASGLVFGLLFEV